MKRTLPVLASLVLLAAPLSAQESATSTANDPTAPVSSYQLQNYYTYSYHNNDSVSSNLLQFRAAIPFSTGELDHIFRLTVPYQTDTVTGADGFGDITLFDLITFDQSWGRFGVGAVALLPTGTDGLSFDKWAIGPAAGFVAQQDWGIWGLFNQNLFTVSGDDSKPDVDVSTLQAVFDYNLSDGWSVGTSEMRATYNWNSNSWISVPLGVSVKKLIETSGNPWQLGLSYEYDFVDQGVRPKETVAFTAKVLIP